MGEWASPHAVQGLLLGLAAAFGVRLALRRAGASLEAGLAVLVPMGAVAVLSYLFTRLAHGPHSYWDASRLAPALGLLRGYGLFPTLEEGPILDYMYGPMAALAFLPAALPSTPTGGVWAGIALSFLMTLSPVLWFALRGAEPRAGLLAAAAAVSFVLLGLADEGMRLTQWRIHADAPALALAGWACALLVTSDTAPTPRRLLAISACAVLAVWAKQIAAPIVVALPLYLWLRDGFRPALRCALWIAGTGIAVSLLFVLWFGLEGMVLNMFLLPSGHPWKIGVLESFGRLVATGRWSLVLVALAVALAWGSERPTASWLRAHAWLGFVWVGLWMLPTATLGGVKVGGDAASYAMTTYFTTAAASLGLARLTAADARWRGRLACGALLGVVALSVGAEVVREERRRSLEEAVLRVQHWRDNPQEQAVAFARLHPDGAYFTSNPLIGLYADGVLYHDLKGFYDRTLAGYDLPSPELRRAHFPRDLRYVAVRSRGEVPQPPRQLFPAFTALVRAEGMEHYHVWERP